MQKKIFGKIQFPFMTKTQQTRNREELDKEYYKKQKNKKPCD